jgi:hypothetical protein
LPITYPHWKQRKPPIEVETVAALAVATGVSRGTLDKWIRAGRLAKTTRGAFSTADVDRLVRLGMEAPAGKVVAPSDKAGPLTEAERAEIARRGLHEAREREAKARLARIAQAKAAIELAELANRLIDVDSARDALRQMAGLYVQAVLSLMESECIAPELRDAFRAEVEAQAAELEKEAAGIKLRRAQVDDATATIVEEVED